MLSRIEEGGELLYQAKTLLAKAVTIDEVRAIRDQAMAIRAYLGQQRAGLEMQNNAAEIKIRAERRLGEFLSETVSAGNPNLQFSHDGRIGKLPEGINHNQSSRWQKIAGLGWEVFEEHLEETKALGNELTTSSVLHLAKEQEGIKTVHVSWNSGQNEWYTPSYIIEKARYVMEGIELDPASSEIANATVKAQDYFTIVDNGLEQDWWGKVWLNPPYSQPDIANFAKAVITKSYDQIMILVNNATETDWFQMMAAHVNIVCLVNKRVKFFDKTGSATGAPLQGQAILYKGPNINRFLDAFKEGGLCLMPLI
jgi:phage N-6-adenine-methyltransferase